jgi:hypothetical protein
MSGPQGHGAAGRIRSIEKNSDVIRNRIRDLPACIIVPKATMQLDYKVKSYSYFQFTATLVHSQRQHTLSEQKYEQVSAEVFILTFLRIHQRWICGYNPC